MTRLTNKLRWTATVLKNEETVDEFDRPKFDWIPDRKIHYADIGTTANDVFLAQQAKTDVVRKIRCRLDKSISRKNNRIQIGDDCFLIPRIYWDEENHMMELSLNYVD